jgi:cytoskeletal protein RodZ
MASMASVAEQLRSAREARSLTVTQVADTTKIRGDHIRALEEGNYDVFVAPVYIRGFIRTYATLLKLDVPRLMAELDAELHRTEKFSEPPAFSGPPRGLLDFVMLQLSKVDWRKGVIVLAALGLVGLVIFGVWVWKWAQGRDPLANLPPALNQPVRTNQGETLPLPSPSPRRP